MNKYIGCVLFKIKMFSWQWWCGKMNSVVVPDNNSECLQEYYSNILENNDLYIENDFTIECKAKKYGVCTKRYKTLMRTHGMTTNLMDFLHENGWNFNDTTQDIFLMGFLNNPESLKGSVFKV